MREFVTSDEHHGHENIIRMCNRPFANTTEMTRVIIEKHNAKVPKDVNSITYHLGDMFWRNLTVQEALEILRAMHGQHSYVWGNHEEVIERDVDAFRRHFREMLDIDTIKWQKHKIVLCHYAMRVWDKSHAGSWMLYGHSHGELPPAGLSFDVGVDAHDFEPWSMDEIAAKMATLKQNHIIPPEKVMPFTELGKSLAK